MQKPIVPTDDRHCTVIVCLLACILLAGWSLPSPANQLARSAEELAQLENRIGKLSAKLAAESREEGLLTAELDAVELELSELRRSIRQQSEQEQALGSELQQLEAESKRLEDLSRDASRRLGQLLRSGYMLGDQSGLRMLVNQEDPHKAARRMAMFRYVIAARNEQIAEIANLEQLVEENKNQLASRQKDLAATRQALEADQQAMEKQRQLRNERVDRLRVAMAETSAEIGASEKRQQDLERLMAELRKPPPKSAPEQSPAAEFKPVLKPAPVAANRNSRLLPQPANNSRTADPEQATVSASGSANTGESSAAQSTPAPEVAPEVAQDIAVKVRPGFGNNRGTLPKPLTAGIRARFGDRREEGGLEWQGILFGARDGQAVRAVYPGQVVFSDWFRGFGQLLVVEHGDGYMSLYGHNRSLNVAVGETVSAGQVIASASDQNAVPVSGLYFEIRHNGTPDDPLQWIR